MSYAVSYDNPILPEVLLLLQCALLDGKRTLLVLHSLQKDVADGKLVHT